MLRRAGRGALTLVALLLGASASTDPGNREAYPARRPGELIVKFRQSADGIERATILSELGAGPTRRLAGINARLTTISTMSVERAIERFRGHPAIEYIEPNYILRAAEICRRHPCRSRLGWSRVRATPWRRAEREVQDPLRSL